MMLAGITHYTRLWQLPMFVAFAGAWLIGGAYLTRWSLRRFGGFPKSKSSTARSAKINLLAGGAGLAAAGIIMLLFLALGLRYGPLWLVIPGIALAPVLLMGMSWLTHLTILNVPGKQALRITGSTAGPLVVLLAVVGVAAFVPAWYIRQAEVRRAYCRGNLQALRAGLAGYAARFPGVNPPDLKTLVTTGFVDVKDLVCPGRPDEEVGYLYVPSPVVPPTSWKARVCDRRGNHGDIRVMLFDDGRILALSDKEFRELLTKPENAPMRKLVEADP